MRSSLLVVALPVALLSASSAVALDECNLEGRPAIFGAETTYAFDVRSGQGCQKGMHVSGTIASSEISQHAQHGTVKMIDRATWTYEPTQGYRGPDSFAITAKGQSPDEKPGTSVIRFRVNVN